MHINPVSGLIRDIDYIASPNSNNRPADKTISLIVIHNISLPPNTFGGPYIEQLFCNQLSAEAHPYFATICHLQVSAHILIRRTGEFIQFVPFHKRAWHAGISSFQEHKNCNDYSIGIELEGTDHIPYADEQYRTLANLITSLQQRYPAITQQRIVGHNDIAPERKTDPGPAFNWDYLFKRLSHKK